LSSGALTMDCGYPQINSPCIIYRSYSGIHALCTSLTRIPLLFVISVLYPTHFFLAEYTVQQNEKFLKNQSFTYRFSALLFRYSVIFLFVFLRLWRSISGLTSPKTPLFMYLFKRTFHLFTYCDIHCK